MRVIISDGEGAIRSTDELNGRLSLSLSLFGVN